MRWSKECSMLSPWLGEDIHLSYLQFAWVGSQIRTLALTTFNCLLSSIYFFISKSFIFYPDFIVIVNKAINS